MVKIDWAAVFDGVSCYFISERENITKRVEAQIAEQEKEWVEMSVTIPTKPLVNKDRELLGTMTATLLHGRRILPGETIKFAVNDAEQILAEIDRRHATKGQAA